ncbi:hypothetical protein KI387_005813, partial [Taxus chinensis]
MESTVYLAMAMAMAMGIVVAVLSLWRLRRPSTHQQEDHDQVPVVNPPVMQSGTRRMRRRTRASTSSSAITPE